jgi:hypothetical protein
VPRRVAQWGLADTWLADEHDQGAVAVGRFFEGGVQASQLNGRSNERRFDLRPPRRHMRSVIGSLGAHWSELSWQETQLSVLAARLVYGRSFAVHAATCARDLKPSLLKICLTCTSTVPSVMTTLSAISRLL